MKKILDIIKTNSLNESVLAGDIADTDEIVSGIIEQKQIDSLAYQICDVQPIHGPTGAIFALMYDKINKKSIVKKSNVTVEDSPLLDTGYTLESIKDIQSQFGKNMNDFITKSFSGVSASSENDNLLTKIDTWSKDDGTLTLSSPGNAETTVFETSQRVAENVLKLNSKNYRTLDAYAILPQSVAASFLALSSYFTDEASESGLFVGKTTRIKYYVNPDPLADTVYVGLKSKIPGQSSIILSPYQYSIIKAQNADTGEMNMFTINRYAMTLSPLSETDNEMLRKFTIA